jgi:hypothetical protein
MSIAVIGAFRGSENVDLSYLFSAGIFVQLALLFYVLGLLARNELVLRGCLLTGTTFYILYYYFVSDAPLWDAIWTSSVIGTTNLFMICIILREKSTIGMAPEMLTLFKSFPTLNPGQFRKMMTKADWITAERDTQICEHGVGLDHLYLVSSGAMEIHRDGRDVQIGSGNFIGEISFLIGGPATADVFAPKGTRYVRWNRNELKAMMSKSPRLSNAIGALFNTDIARKLSVSWPASGV